MSLGTQVSTNGDTIVRSQEHGQRNPLNDNSLQLDTMVFPGNHHSTYNESNSWNKPFNPLGGNDLDPHCQQSTTLSPNSLNHNSLSGLHSTFA